jgi:hypothetical protein
MARSRPRQGTAPPDTPGPRRPIISDPPPPRPVPLRSIVECARARPVWSSLREPHLPKGNLQALSPTGPRSGRQGYPCRPAGQPTGCLAELREGASGPVSSSMDRSLVQSPCVRAHGYRGRLARRVDRTETPRRVRCGDAGGPGRLCVGSKSFAVAPRRASSMPAANPRTSSYATES